MLGAPSAEPLGAAADDPAGAALLPGAALDDVSGDEPDGDEGGVAPPPQAKSTARGRKRLTRRIVAPPYHA